MTVDTELGSCRPKPRAAVIPGSPQEPEEVRKYSFLKPSERGPVTPDSGLLASGTVRGYISVLPSCPACGLIVASPGNERTRPSPGPLLGSIHRTLPPEALWASDPRIPECHLDVSLWPSPGPLQLSFPEQGLAVPLQWPGRNHWILEPVSPKMADTTWGPREHSPEEVSDNRTLERVEDGTEEEKPRSHL